MELIGREGGFGIFQLDRKERVLLDKMHALASGQHNFKKSYSLGWPRDSETQEFSALARDLFPEVPFDHSSYTVYCPQETSHYYRPFAPYVELRIDSHFPEGTIINEHGNNRSGLTILFSELAEQNQYPVSMALLEFYKPGVADDIVDILKSREMPVLEGLTHLPFAGRTEKDQDRGYGIAEVHRLGSVLKLYGRSNVLVQNSKNLTGVSKHGLGILRRDSMDHENLVMRDLSRERYQKELQRLVNH